MFVTEQFRRQDVVYGRAVSDINCRFRPFEYAWILDKINPETDMIVDSGCGGMLYPLKFELAKICRYKVIGVDLDPELDMIKRIGNLDLVVSKMEDMPFIDSGSKNCIVSVSVLEHVTEAVKDAVIKEWSRVLCVGGRVLITVDYPRVDIKEMTNKFLRNGFKTSDPLDFNPSAYAFGIVHIGMWLHCWVCEFVKGEK